MADLTRMLHFISSSFASPADLSPAELYAATGAFVLNIAGLVLLRALTRRGAVEKPEAAEYDEAA